MCTVLLYLHNCRHDVRRHIREAKCVDIRHKTTCRVTIDTCPLLSFLCLFYRTSQTANNFKTTATHEKQKTQGTKPKFSKQQTKTKILVSSKIKQLLNSSRERDKSSVTFHTWILTMSTCDAHGGGVKKIDWKSLWHTKSHLSHQIKEESPKI